MTETASEAALRFFEPMLKQGYKLLALHEYTNAEGVAIYWRIRGKRPATGEKWIRPMHRNGNGFELAEPKFPEGKKPLYALHPIASSQDAVVWIVEGEQKADALNKLGLVATTSGGATSAEKADWEPLKGRKVIVWPDYDAPGLGYAGEVANITLGLGCAVSCVEVDKLGLADGEDVIQWLEAHPDAGKGEIEALPMLTPSPATGNAPVGDPVGRIAYRRASDIKAKPIRWLWQGRIARGKVSMLAGNPGLGKSQITASMAAIVSTGGCWPVDRTRCETGNVVILSAEDDAADTIRPRLEAAGADLSRVLILDAVVEGYRGDGGEILRAFNLKTDLAQLGVMLDEIGGAALIVIDPITAYLGDTDSHKNAEIRALLSPLSDLAAKHAAAVVCVSHFNKASGGEALMRVTGSLAFVAAARGAFVVAKDPENEARRLFLPLKNNIGNDKTGLAFAIESAEVKSAAGLIESSRVMWEAEAVSVTADEAMGQQADPADRDEIDEAKDFLRKLLAGGPVPSKQIKAEAKEAGHAWRTIFRAKKALGIKAKKDGFKDGWEWKLSPEECQTHPKNATQFVWQPSHSSGDGGILRGNEGGPVEVEI